MAFEAAVQALDPIKVVVWGEKAMAFHGVKALLNVCPYASTCLLKKSPNAT